MGNQLVQRTKKWRIAFYLIQIQDEIIQGFKMGASILIFKMAIIKRFNNKEIWRISNIFDISQSNNKKRGINNVILWIETY